MGRQYTQISNTPGPLQLPMCRPRTPLAATVTGSTSLRPGAAGGEPCWERTTWRLALTEHGEGDI